jgi:hypothetical protein
MEVTTAFGTTSTPESLEAALDRLPEGDPDEFVAVQQGDAFLQMRQLPIELGRGGKLYRARVPEALRAIFRDFAAGRAGWDRGIEWIDLEALRRRPMSRSAKVATLVVAAFACVAVGWALGRILPRV